MSLPPAFPSLQGRRRGRRRGRGAEPSQLQPGAGPGLPGEGLRQRLGCGNCMEEGSFTDSPARPGGGGGSLEIKLLLGARAHGENRGEAAGAARGTPGAAAE